jgi:Flp pilus assembly protein TadG
MKDSRHMIAKLYNRRGHLGERGVAAVEMAIILPLMLIIVFAIVDFGRLMQARLVITALAREGGSLSCRDIQGATNLVTMLQDGASPLDLVYSGRIYIWKIRAGSTTTNPDPTVDTTNSAFQNTGGLNVSSSITYDASTKKLDNGCLSPGMYAHLVFNNTNQTADISEVNVVEVFYKYTPISPISNFIPGLLTSSGGGAIIRSKAVF